MLKAILKEAWISIASYKLRTFLTMLGIVIGVSAVVMMVSAGSAVQLHITKSFSALINFSKVYSLATFSALIVHV